MAGNGLEVALPDSPFLSAVARSCPAKLNLRLAVTGRRADGFHELISLVAPISLVDEVTVQWVPEADDDRLEITGPVALVAEPDNLVLRAVRAYRSATGVPGSYHLRLEKRIPFGAGLGGGSSDAAGVLRALQTLWGEPLAADALARLAVGLGADVPFFLEDGPALMRGMGERLERVPEWSTSLARWQVVVFQPPFPISTPWAYRRLAENPENYADAAAEEALYATWRAAGDFPESGLANSFRRVVDGRYPAIPVLLQQLREGLGVVAEMSGSGSACFALCGTDHQRKLIVREVVECWGETAFCAAVHFL